MWHLSSAHVSPELPPLIPQSPYSFPNQLQQITFHWTVLLTIHNHIISSMNKTKIGALILLDPSAAFDTVDDNKHLHHNEQRFGLPGPSLLLLSSKSFPCRYAHLTKPLLHSSMSTASFHNISKQSFSFENRRRFENRLRLTSGPFVYSAFCVSYSYRRIQYAGSQ